MLSSLTLERFKAFGAETRIELAPITLIYGENSAGKSSILQSLSLLKQTLESPEREPDTALLPRAEEGLVDLGSFRELLFDHDISNALKLGVEVDPVGQSGSPPPRMSSRQRFGRFDMHFTFGQDHPSSDVRLTRLHFLRDRLALDYETRRLKPTELSEFDPYWFRSRTRGTRTGGRGYALECKSISRDKEVWQPIYGAWHTSRDQVVEALQRGFTLRSRQRLMSGSRAQVEGHAKGQEQLDNALKFYRSDFTLRRFIKRVCDFSDNQLSLLDGFIPRGVGPARTLGLPETELTLRRDRHLRDLPSLAFADNLAQAGFLTAEALNAVFPLGPFRRPPERWYMFTGTSPTDVGYRGDHLPDLLLKQPRLRRRANDWLERLGIGYRLKLRRIGGSQSDLFAVRLEDTRRKEPVEVALSDVGFGISQILPFLVQCLASQRQIISIEQPEVHIHPRLQADLGDLIAESVSEPFEHQFLIETHSEHLLLRLQKLIHSGALRPADVSVIYVSRGEQGSTARRLHLDKGGDLVDEWPGGFFPERLREFR